MTFSPFFPAIRNHFNNLEPQKAQRKKENGVPYFLTFKHKLGRLLPIGRILPNFNPFKIPIIFFLFFYIDI